ncbi:MAG TPA: hypothetical protein VM390_03965 [Acidimicrobiales bacterium]|jgi:hypothetical protein|nr:hypothetical protein [Acidimicrobiales bacterium]
MMAIDVETKDTTALSDAELSEMADISAEGATGYEAGVLSKVRDDWVLVTQASEGGQLGGFAFCTLERIGGTPCVLLGMAAVARNANQEAMLKALVGDELRRAVLAFPDEDVLVATRLAEASGYAMFTDLEDVVPRPGHKPTGEERAWARRLAKRFGGEGKVNDRTFVLDGAAELPGLLDYSNGSPGPDYDAFFAEVDRARGDTLIVFGWAMAEYLAPLASR